MKDTKTQKFYTSERMTRIEINRIKRERLIAQKEKPKAEVTDAQLKYIKILCYICKYNKVDFPKSAMHPKDGYDAKRNINALESRLQHIPKNVFDKEYEYFYNKLKEKDDKQ